MGEKYWFAISLIDIPKELKIKYKEMGDEDFTLFMEREYYTLFKKIYLELLKTHEWFPIFGKIESSGSKGYGYGSQTEKDGEFDKCIIEFTKQFPEFTFGIYLFYFDLSELIYWNIKNDIINKSSESHDPIKTNIGLTINIRYSKGNISINNNIIDAFEKYDYDIDFLSF